MRTANIPMLFQSKIHTKFTKLLEEKTKVEASGYDSRPSNVFLRDTLVDINPNYGVFLRLLLTARVEENVRHFGLQGIALHFILTVNIFFQHKGKSCFENLNNC